MLSIEQTLNLLLNSLIGLLLIGIIVTFLIFIIYLSSSQCKKDISKYVEDKYS